MNQNLLLKQLLSEVRTNQKLIQNITKNTKLAKKNYKEKGQILRGKQIPLKLGYDTRTFYTNKIYKRIPVIYKDMNTGRYYAFEYELDEWMEKYHQNNLNKIELAKYK